MVSLSATEFSDAPETLCDYGVRKLAKTKRHAGTRNSIDLSWNRKRNGHVFLVSIVTTIFYSRYNRVARLFLTLSSTTDNNLSHIETWTLNCRFIVNVTACLLLSFDKSWYYFMLSNCLFYVYEREEEREYPTSRASFRFLAWGGEKDSLSESRQPFEVVEDQTSGPVNLVFSPQTVFFFRARASVYW